MTVKHMVEGVYVVPMRKANAFLIEGQDGLTLVNAGLALKETAVFGEILPIAGGIKIIHVPTIPVGFESLEDGRASQRKLASLSFDAAGFGHRKPIAKRCIDAFPEQVARHRPPEPEAVSEV
jgi:hypothetical protein